MRLGSDIYQLLPACWQQQTHLHDVEIWTYRNLWRVCAVGVKPPVGGLTEARGKRVCFCPGAQWHLHAPAESFPG